MTDYVEKYQIKISDPELKKRKSELFSEPIQPTRITKDTNIRDLMNAFERASFQSRALGTCAHIFDEMLRDKGRPTIMLGISGSLIAAGMRQVIVDLIENHMVDVIISTGAIIGQDHYQVLGGGHYRGSPALDDRVLRDLYIDRLYDTLMCEEKYWAADQFVAEFCATLEQKNLSSRQFLDQMARVKAINDPHSILGACARNNIPLFVPALNDSSIGIGITQYYHNAREAGVEPLTINGMQDNYELTQIVNKSRATAAIYIGGGVPKNYINDSVVMTYIFNKDTGGHKYAIQLTMTGPQDGGLSGSTLSEATSWGKVSKKATHQMAYVEVSIGLPLVYGYALQNDSAKGRSRIQFKWDNDILVSLD